MYGWILVWMAYAYRDVIFRPGAFLADFHPFHLRYQICGGSPENRASFLTMPVIVALVLFCIFVGSTNAGKIYNTNAWCKETGIDAKYTPSG